MDLTIDNKRGLEFSKNKFLVQLRDDFLPIYLSPALGKMGLTCDSAEVETSESVEFLVAAFKTLRNMVIDHAWEPQTLDEFQMQQKLEADIDLRHYLLSRMLIFSIEHEEFKTQTMQCLHLICDCGEDWVEQLQDESLPSDSEFNRQVLPG